MQKNLKPFYLPNTTSECVFSLHGGDFAENNLHFFIKKLKRILLPEAFIAQINKLVQELLIILDNIFEFKDKKINNGQKIRYLLLFALKFFKNFKNEGITKMTKNSIINKVNQSLSKLSISSLTDDLNNFREQLSMYSLYFKEKIYTRFSNATNDFFTSLANKVFEKYTSINDNSSLQESVSEPIDDVVDVDDSDDDYYDAEESDDEKPDLSKRGGVLGIKSIMPKLKVYQYIQNSHEVQTDFTSLYFLINPTQLSYQSILEKIVQWTSLEYYHSIFRIGFKIILGISGIPKQDRLFSIKKNLNEVLSRSYNELNIIIQEIIELIPKMETTLIQAHQPVKNNNFEEVDGGKYSKKTQKFKKKKFYLTGGSILDIIFQSKELMKYWLT